MAYTSSSCISLFSFSVGLMNAKIYRKQVSLTFSNIHSIVEKLKEKPKFKEIKGKSVRE